MRVGETADIRDIKGLIGIYGWTRLSLVLGLAVLAIIIVFLYLSHRKKNKPSPTVALPQKPAHELAIEKIAVLREWALNTGNMKRFHFELSDIIRHYLESRFGIPATDRTAEELQTAIHRLPLLTVAQKAAYFQLLKSTDLVKFTDQNPGEATSKDLLEIAEKFVRETQNDHGSREVAK